MIGIDKTIASVRSISGHKHPFRTVVHLSGLTIVLIACFYFGLSEKLPVLPFQSDKFGHFIGFAILTAAFGICLRNFTKALFLAVAVGTGIEFAQILVPAREFSYFDILANNLGAIAVWCCVFGIQSVHQPINK